LSPRLPHVSLVASIVQQHFAVLVPHTPWYPQSGALLTRKHISHLIGIFFTHTQSHICEM